MEFTRQEAVVEIVETSAGRAGFVARERYAWPGGYELYAVTDDGGVLCNDCCRTEAPCIDEALPGDGWFVDGIASVEMDEEAVVCDHCGRTVFDPEAV